MKIDIILLDSSLELVPKEIVNHPSVVKNAMKRGKRPEQTILDISLHYSAMKNLPNFRKRGRPDILHQTLLLILEEKIMDEIYIHTIDSKIIRVDPSMRPPKNYDRFIGLMEKLLIEGRVPKENNPLMEILNVKLEDIVKGKNPILLSEDGKRTSPEALCKDNNLIGIGAFQSGDFSSEVKSYFYERYSISSRVLEAQQVVCRLLSGCNYLLGWP
ncbi:16S rRNA methyltransferase [Candidatus Acidianus copahuensis]|uniref:16S rRNA methyltransferase n=1 Tax=Acidianus TaxID=12914 RepID=UPI0009DEC5B7|nr:16S rRNA methyltransferase [Candidatus Acidianus copahuensis]NON62306.1 16S rRNA methyltransferase [Acidianus sp. RZ1]